MILYFVVLLTKHIIGLISHVVSKKVRKKNEREIVNLLSFLKVNVMSIFCYIKHLIDFEQYCKIVVNDDDDDVNDYSDCLQYDDEDDMTWHVLHTKIYDYVIHSMYILLISLTFFAFKFEEISQFFIRNNVSRTHPFHCIVTCIMHKISWLWRR